ncbi:putative ABC transport system permease protein [Pedobacter sp. UYEF25]
MLKNYFKTAWRNIKKNKVYSFINILGLTLGLGACMLVATVVIDDLSYDEQWSNQKELYRIVTVNKMGDGLYNRFTSSFAGLSDKLRNDFPEVLAVGKLNNTEDRFRIRESEDPNGINLSVLQADTSIWKLLDLKILSGNPKHYVDGQPNIVISESFRKKHFKDENPVGRVIHDVPTYSDKATPYLVTGVIEDISSNSIFRSEAIVIEKGRKEDLKSEQYGSFTPNNFILTKPGVDINKFTKKLNNWYTKFVTVKKPYQYEFQPLGKVYLHSEFSENQKVKGDIQNVYIFCGVALLLLVIACVNFINLSSAKALQRLPETGVRKILGADRKQIIFQFLAESILFFLISTIIATLIYWVSMPFLEQYLGNHLEKNFTSGYLLLGSAYGIIFIISLITGSYPAWIVSGLKPAATLKGNLFSGSIGGHQLVRKSLVVLQFSISIVVVIALIVVKQQINFMKNKDLGFDKKNLMNIGYISWGKKGQTLKNELLAQEGIESVSITSWTPTSAGYMTKEIDDPNHKGNKLTIWYINGDVDLAKTLGLQLKEGRLLNNTFATDKMSDDSLMRLSRFEYENTVKIQSSVITAYTASLLSIKKLNEPIQNALTTPVGIVKDFNAESLKKPIQPTIITAENAPTYGNMLVRVKTGYQKQAIESVNKLWRQFFPDKLLDVQWVDDMMFKEYRAERRLQELFAFFSGLSMLLACLGIFALIIHTAQQRMKEIGIRKVLGASVLQISSLLSKDFLQLVLMAIVIASPIAWYAINTWLEDFAYRITISWSVFAIAGLGAILIALITISFRAIKAALANPVKSLRTE